MHYENNKWNSIYRQRELAHGWHSGVIGIRLLRLACFLIIHEKASKSTEKVTKKEAVGLCNLTIDFTGGGRV